MRLTQASSKSGINPDLYDNTRCTYQRKADAKIGHGWVETISDDEVIVRMRDNLVWQESDEASFEIFGLGKNLRCMARLSAQMSAPNAEVGALCIFRILGSPRITEGQPNARLCNQDVTAIVKIKGEFITPEPVPVQDISRTGLAIFLPTPIEPGETAELDLLTDQGRVTMRATIVVYSRLMDTHGYRHGFKIAEMGRVDAVNWHKIFERK
ncbi:MAG: PilZ domain-containing protein [Fimbriimonadaceae bacterium]